MADFAEEHIPDATTLDTSLEATLALSEQSADVDDDAPEALAADSELLDVGSELKILMADLDSVSVRIAGIAQSEVQLFEERIAALKELATAEGQFDKLRLQFNHCDDALDLLARPLPAGYRMGKYASGRTFFINDVTKQTQWDDPRDTVVSEASIQLLAEDFEVLKADGKPLAAFFKKLVSFDSQMVATDKVPELGAAFYELFDVVDIACKPMPDGWEKRRQGADTMFRPFFVNHSTKSTSWNDPRDGVGVVPAVAVAVVASDGSVQSGDEEVGEKTVLVENETIVVESHKEEEDDNENDDDGDDEKDLELKAHSRMRVVSSDAIVDETPEERRQRARKEAKERVMAAVMESGLGDDENAIEDAKKQAENFARIMEVGTLDKPVYIEDVTQRETEEERQLRLFGSVEEMHAMDNLYAKKMEDAWRKHQLSQNVGTGAKVELGCDCFYKHCYYTRCCCCCLLSEGKSSDDEAAAAEFNPGCQCFYKNCHYRACCCCCNCCANCFTAHCLGLCCGISKDTVVQPENVRRSHEGIAYDPVAR